MRKSVKWDKQGVLGQVHICLIKFQVQSYFKNPDLHFTQSIWRLFPHNIRAIMAKIKLPENPVACYCFESS